MFYLACNLLLKPSRLIGEIRVVSLLSKKMALRSSAPIKTNMALVAAAKDEEQKLKRKKEQLPVKSVS